VVGVVEECAVEAELLHRRRRGRRRGDLHRSVTLWIELWVWVWA
jgi:hypothetical protein